MVATEVTVQLVASIESHHRGRTSPLTISETLIIDSVPQFYPLISIENNRISGSLWKGTKRSPNGTRQDSLIPLSVPNSYHTPQRLAVC